MPNVFISYVRQNSDQVDRLADVLRWHGVNVWLDREQIMPGADWKYAIRQAIREGDYFIACFSAEYVARRRTYMNTEIGLAIDMLQEMPADRVWFIPVLLSECKIPDRTIGGGQTLRDLQWEPLYKDWAKSAQRILKAMGVERKVYEPELIRIPAGEFMMGNDMHPVEVAEFYIGKYPVTNQQYEVFVQTNDREFPKHWTRGRTPAGKENHPVVYVSWHDSIAFCDWLSQATSRKFRLPTEAEWEKAARSTDGREYPWGNEPPTEDLCNFGMNVGDTTPVDRYPNGANPYGVLDIGGNVWEWTKSLYRDYPYDPNDGREDESVSDKRVVRGGSCRDDVRFVRCAYRDEGSPPLSRYDHLGFRVVCVSGIMTLDSGHYGLSTPLRSGTSPHSESGLDPEYSVSKG